MRDPVVEAARDEARRLLGLVYRLGGLRIGIEEDPDADLRIEAQIDLKLRLVAGWRGDLSDEVCRYLLALLAGPPSRERGRPRNTVRDRFLVDVIDRIEKVHGIDPTRKHRRRACGCSIVADVLAELGAAIDEPAVKQVWQRLRDEANHERLPMTITPADLDKK